ncbi:MAG: aryl-sulfate sulfotransferase [Chthoniobacterales bacterium]|nr:aryl-sulfate sulfotransferase [Chthoniobacterales bacterium]
MRTWLITFAVAFSLVDLTILQGGQSLGSATYYPGATPFISFVQLSIPDLANVRNAQFQIAPKTGSATRPVNVKYSRKYLQKRGYLNRGLGQVTVPVFGLYAGRNNTVTLTVGFRDGTSQVTEVIILTAAYDGGTYSNPTVVQARLPGTTLSYDFILLKSYADPTTPIIVDSDAEVRWIGTANIGTQDVALFDNAFYLGAGSFLYRTEFDGTTTVLADYSSIGVTGFHHNLDPGKTGLILDVDTVNDIECVNLEVDKDGNVLKTWNLADIVSAAMVAGGDNPNQFVKRAPIDWFHNNATAYRASDNSLIVSSRENFVIALDYDSGAIKWILGDPTKRWYDFSSLRAFALSLGPDTLPPIGQHAVSISGDQLLLFDNGTGSIYQMPPGETRDYSAPRKYQLDLANSTATEVWHYLPEPSIYSPFCSSVYEDATDNYLIDYTLGGPYVFTGIVGLDGQGNKAFDYRYEELDFCGTAWNAAIIHWENLQLK